ncbi:MAG: response regulator [Bryobacteraceae bacterium]
MRLVVPELTIWWELAMADQEDAIILVVDEEPQILQLVRLILSRDGWRVACARSVRQALRICRRSSGRIALMLVDAFTAETHRPDWIERLRASAGGAPIVVMSAMAPEEAVSGYAFLAKPFTPEALQNTVRATLGRNAQAAGR